MALGPRSRISSHIKEPPPAFGVAIGKDQIGRERKVVPHHTYAVYDGEV